MAIEGSRSVFNFSDNRIQRSIQQSQLNINKTIERLSTGLRLNRAADNPTSFSVAQKVESRILSQNQAAANTRAGEILVATAAEGAQGILESLKAIRSLTLESLSDTSSSLDRNNLQKELTKIVSAIDQLARNTRFNGRTLLDGSAAGGSLFEAATVNITTNQQVSDNTDGVGFSGPFIREVTEVDKNITDSSILSFRLFDTGASGNAGLEIRSSTLGVITVTDDYAAFPDTYGIPVDAAGALVSVSLADLGFNEAGPLTLNEYQTRTLQSLIDDRRIAPVTFGSLNLNLGGVDYNGVLNIQPNQTLEDVVNGLNNVSLSSGTLSASFDPSSSRITLSYSNQQTLLETTNTTYTPAVPVSAGGPFLSFGALGAAGEGPAYRNPDPFLPGTPFDKNALPVGSVFPTLPSALDTTLDFTGTDASILSAFGLNNVADSGLITDYEAFYSGVTLATGNPSEYVNRTLVEIEQVYSENEARGVDTGLETADGDTRLSVLGTAKVDVPAFGAGEFTIDFGANGVYTFAGFDPAVHTIQDIVDDINAYGTGNGLDVSASFDANSNRITINNTPGPKVDDPGFLAGGEFTINFGFNGIFDSATYLGGFDPDNQTIDDVVDAINTFGIFNSVAVSASYDAATDRLRITNSVPIGLGLNQIVFGGANGDEFQDFFKVNSDFGGLLGSVTVTSTSDIDNSHLNTAYDVTASDVTSTPLSDLFLPTGSNGITFGGVNGVNIQNFFKLSNVPDSGTSVSQSAVSNEDISSQAIDPALDVTFADVSGATLEELFTPPISFSGGVPSGDLVINGQTLITVGANTTLNDIVNAINNATGTNNRDYRADFDSTVSGGLFIGVTDTESLNGPGTSATADPNGASPQVNQNQITLDSAAFIAAEAPLSYNSGTPLGTGSGPAEQVSFQSTPLSAQYGVNAPDGNAANISGIQFSGSNIAGVLGLSNTSSGNASVVGGSERYRGIITYTGNNTYNLAADFQQDYSATSSTTSSQAVGVLSNTGQSTPFGVVAELFITGSKPFDGNDQALVLQTGIDEGQTYRLEIADLTASALGLEGLNLVGSDDTTSRLQGNGVLQTVDRAIEQVLGALSGLGVDQRILDQHESGLTLQKINMENYLSDLRDADVSEEIGNLTRAQINAQAANFALTENRRIQSGLMGSLLGDIRLLNY